MRWNMKDRNTQILEYLFSYRKIHGMISMFRKMLSYKYFLWREKIMKKLRVIIWGVGFGVLVLTLRRLLHIPDHQFLSFYLIASVVFILCALTVNIIWQISFQKKLAGLSRILYQQKDPDRFIAENEKLLQTVKSEFNKGLILINISAGYSEKEDYRRAKDILLQVSEKHIKGFYKVIYNHNLCYFYFMLGENTSGLAVFNANRNVFMKFENHPTLGGSIAVNRIYCHIAAGETEQAKLLYGQAKSKYTDPRFDKDWAKLDKILASL